MSMLDKTEHMKYSSLGILYWTVIKVILCNLIKRILHKMPFHTKLI